MSLSRSTRTTTLGALLLLLAGAAPARAALTATPRYDFQFSGGDHDFAPEDFCALWHWGVPVGTRAGLGIDPVWATGEPYDGNGDGVQEAVAVGYINNCISSLLSPELELTDLADVTLSMEHYIDTWPADGECVAALEAGDDSHCGDGGRMRLRYLNGTTVEIEPEAGYTTLVAEEDAVFGAFGGQTSSGFWITRYFDLYGLNTDDLRVEMRFVSNSTQYEYNGWLIRSMTVWEGDIIPPSPSIPAPVEDTSDVVGPYVVRAKVTDNREVTAVSLFYAVEGAAPIEVQMTREAGDPDFWTGGIPGQISSTDVAYYVVATDNYGNRATAPEGDPLTFRVRLAAPEGLELVDKPVQATTLDLRWRAPVEKYTVRDYHVLHQVVDAEGQVLEEAMVGDLDGDPTDLIATVPASGYPGRDRYSVQARYEVPLGGGGMDLVFGDFSEPVSLMLVVPSIRAISPEFAFQGSFVELQVEGMYTTFVEGDLEATLGEGIDVQSTQVRDVTYCSLFLQIDGAAPTGNHPLVMEWPGVEPGSTMRVVLDPGLLVRSASERPQVVAVEPGEVDQRQTKTIKFTGEHTDFMRDPPVVDFQTGIVAGPVTVLSATEFEVSIEVATWAPPGERTITVVSGGFSVEAPFRVNVPISTGGSCSCDAGGDAEGGLLPLLALLGCALRLRVRRRGGADGLRGEHAVPRLESKDGEEPGPGGPDPYPGVARRDTGSGGAERTVRDLRV